MNIQKFIKNGHANFLMISLLNTAMAGVLVMTSLYSLEAKNSSDLKKEINSEVVSLLKKEGINEKLTQVSYEKADCEETRIELKKEIDKNKEDAIKIGFNQIEKIKEQVGIIESVVYNGDITQMAKELTGVLVQEHIPETEMKLIGNEDYKIKVQDRIQNLKNKSEKLKNCSIKI